MKISIRAVTLFLIIFSIVSCTNSAEDEVVDVVSGYENALKAYDSDKAVQFLHPKLIKNTYGSEEQFHELISHAFDSIKKAGGIVSTTKGKVYFKDDIAYVETSMITQQSTQTVTIELKKHQDKWLIYKLP